MDSELATLLIPVSLMLVLLFLGFPIGVALGFAGLIGFAMVSNADASMLRLGRVAYQLMLNYAFSPIVLFVFMGEVIVFTGIGSQLFEGVSKWTGRIPGSLAVSTVGASALFGAICGVSVAGTLTIGELAISEMRKRNYGKAMAAGVVAAGGTLSIMIPPSISFVLYGIIAEQSIGSLFISGIIPGIVISGLFSVYAVMYGIKHPETIPPTKPSWGEKIAALKSIVPVAILFIVVLGSIYAGFATPSEAGALGASGALILAVAYRKLNWRNMMTACWHTALNVGMLLVIFVGAVFFGYYIAMTGYTGKLVDLLVSLPVSPMVIVGLIALFLVILGCFLDTGSMVLLTTPILLPIIKAFGFSPIWYGVILVITCQTALITPPVGMNLFVLTAIAPDIPSTEVIKGAFPFVMILCVAILIIMFFPSLSTWLPSLMIPAR